MRLLSKKTLERFQCTKCEYVLSRGPIFSSICGRCVPNTRDVPNAPVEAFLREFMFPCRYQELGCDKILPFDDKEHEEQCQFQDLNESPFEIIDRSVWQHWKCCSCNNLLTIRPLSLNHEGKSICGRCIKRWTEVHMTETFIRNWQLEFIVKQLSLPCMYSYLGCQQALKCDEVKDHEECCPHRTYSSPVTPYGSCKSVISAGQRYANFDQKYAGSYMTDLKFKQNLDENTNPNRKKVNMRLLSGKLLQHFRCTECSSVLSRGPIFSSICGRCVPSTSDVPNPPLEAFLREYVFPCRYREGGCDKILSFDDKEHEEQCQFQHLNKPPFEIIDRSVWQYWKCCSCNNFLTVGPLSLNYEGKNVCGRCFEQWSKVNNEKYLIRNCKLEFIMKQLPLPCLHHNVGCERALNWSEVYDHEKYCPYRNYSCPVIPHGSCKSVIFAGQIYRHFEEKHAEYLLKNPVFEENLDEDRETNRLLRVENRDFLLTSKIRVNENRVWFDATLVSDPNIAPEIDYSFYVLNRQGTAIMRFHSEIVKPHAVVWKRQEKQGVSIDRIKHYFKEPLFSLTVDKWVNKTRF